MKPAFATAPKQTIIESEKIMRRRLFFWLDRLKITRTERQAIFILLIIFASLLLLNAAISPSSPIDDEYYSELDARFQMRTDLMKQQEQQILARYSGEPVQVAGQDTLPADSSAGRAFADIPESALININTADATALQQLRGIGAAYAQRIIGYRQQNGLFQTANELLKIKGIGEKRLQKIRPFITLGVEAVAPPFSSKNDALPRQKVETEEKTDAKIQVKYKRKGEDKNQAEVKIKGDEKLEFNPEAEVKDRVQYKDEIDDESKTKIDDKKRGEVENKPEKAPFTINVNKADAETLQSLSGIGPAYARRIVEYRQLNGPFETKEQLLDIKGIGEKRLAKIKPFIKLTDQD